MAHNSLFAILLRSPWWASAAIALVLGLISGALLPEGLRVVGALMGLPFVIISALAARRQWQLPSAARVAQTHEAVSAMAWPAFSALLEQAFQRDGYTVQQAAKGSAADMLLEREGRRMVVGARRWKSARIGVEVLRALQVARDDAEASHAVYVGLGVLSEGAVDFARENRITVWQTAEVALALRGLPLAPAAAPSAAGAAKSSRAGSRGAGR